MTFYNINILHYINVESQLETSSADSLFVSPRSWPLFSIFIYLDFFFHLSFNFQFCKNNVDTLTGSTTQRRFVSLQVWSSTCESRWIFLGISWLKCFNSEWNCYDFSLNFSQTPKFNCTAPRTELHQPDTRVTALRAQLSTLSRVRPLVAASE